MSLTVMVVAHEKRYELASKLAKDVEADSVFFDDGFLGEWKNHKRAWESAAKSDCTHAVVLQDDAVPVENFRNHVQEAVNQRSDDLISLYVGTHRPWKEEVISATKFAEERMASWLVAPTLLWGVGLVLPVEMIPDMLEVSKGSKLPYDQRIGSWAEQTDRQVYYTWPSLVDHADTESVAHGEKSQGVRVAHRVGIPNWSDVIVSIRRPGSDFIVPSKRDRINHG